MRQGHQYPPVLCLCQRAVVRSTKLAGVQSSSVSTWGLELPRMVEVGQQEDCTRHSPLPLLLLVEMDCRIFFIRLSLGIEHAVSSAQDSVAWPYAPLPSSSTSCSYPGLQPSLVSPPSSLISFKILQIAQDSTISFSSLEFLVLSAELHPARASLN